MGATSRWLRWAAAPLLAAATAVPAAAQTAALSGLDALVERGLREWQVPGLAVAIVKDGQVVLVRGYGVRDLKSREKVSADTTFFIASASKPFTATLAAMLVAEGKAGWDRPIAADVPAFQMSDPVATTRVTLRDMLSHRTGVPRQEFLKIHAPEHRTDLVSGLRYFEPALEFRTGFRYCNEVVTVAGDLLAQRAGTTWEDLVRQRIFAPLGMTRSVVDVAAMKANGNFASPYIIRRADPEEMAFYDVSELRGPAGAVISTATDLSRWLLFNLNRGVVNGKPLLAAPALAQLYVPQVPATLRPPRYAELSHQSYGLGWFVDTYRGSWRISHPGALYGFSAMVSFLPRENVGVAVLANLHGTPLTEIVERYVYDSLLGLPVVDWSGRMKEDEARARAAYESAPAAAPAAARPAAPAPPRPPESYVGTYTHPGYGTLAIGQSAAGLTIALRSGTFALVHDGHDVFEFHHPVEDQDWRLAFRSGFDGDIEALAMEAIPGQNPLVFARVKGKPRP